MKSVNRVTALNIVSTVLVQGITFLTIPLFSKMLGTEQYGMYSVFNSWVGILSCIMGASVGSSLGTGRYEFKDDYYAFRSSILLFGTLICVAIMGVILIFINPISAYLGYSHELIILLLLLSLGHYIIGFVQGACTCEKAAGTNFAISLVLSVTTVVLSIILILQSPQESRFMGRIYGGCISYVVLSIIMWIVVFSKQPKGLDKKYCKYSLLMGLPIVFHMLSQNVLSQSDRVMMQRFGISNSEIGIYSLFYSFVAVMNIILGALNNSWCPFYYEDLDNKNWVKLKVKCKNYIELFTILVIGFLLLSREVGCLLADSEFWGGIDVIPVLVCGVFFTFMYQFPVNYEFFHRKTQIIAAGTVFTAIVNIFLNALMIPKWGMYGAAIATMISYGALFVAHYFIVTHMKENKYHLNFTVFVPSLVAIGVTIVLFYLLKEFWYIRWGMGFFLGIYELHKIVRRRMIF